MTPLLDTGQLYHITFRPHSCAHGNWVQGRPPGGIPEPARARTGARGCGDAGMASLSSAKGSISVSASSVALCEGSSGRSRACPEVTG